MVAQFKKWLRIIIIVIFPIGLYPVISCSEYASLSNIYVIDGDTIKDSTTDESYRLFGVNTPELQSISEVESVDDAINSLSADFAIQARNHVVNLVNDGVKINSIKNDFYDRVVSKWQNNKGVDIGIDLVANGLAVVQYIGVIDTSRDFLTDDYMYYEKLLEAQIHAHNNRIGVWKYKNVLDEIFM